MYEPKSVLWGIGLSVVTLAVIALPVIIELIIKTIW
jgi:hypothetical protein